MIDEQLQKQIESGLTPTTEDGRFYQQVFKALKQEPVFHVSLPFADRILSKLEKRDEQRDFRWLAFGIFLSVVALVIVLALTNAWTIGVFSFVSGYPGLVIFGVMFIVFLNWVDRKVIRKKVKELHG
jgi:hypothetical protein